MVTLESRGASPWEFHGKSTDTKPTEWEGSPVPVNSRFFELDTQNLFYLDSDKTYKKSGS